ncbi:universal stress protein [Spongiivirga citrea]|uniref:Universal stress protein n=1 Tax=Spongiivirga citrea TaxID=1481457 RepID=A0A6M0CH51_9FLAO|nr:universal stress protein [Spongiivirga citrea]NER16832.1 universal stress protein [Spongiivirga citrea]
MKKVLVPTDFSENAWNAISYAMAFYKNIPVTYILCHIMIPDGLPPVVETLTSYVTGEAVKADEVIKELDAVKKKMRAHSDLKEHQITVTYLESSFVSGIKKIAKQYDIDFIVMGNKGQSNVKDKVIGGHTSTVITKIKYPVMIIPEAAKFHIPVNIAFATDYDFIYKAKVLNTLLEIANVHESNLKVLRVVNTKLSLTPFQQKNRAYLKDFLQNSSASFHRVNQSDLEKGIQSFIDSMNIDMITMVAKNLNFFQKLLFNPRVAKMSYHLQVPFLVLHE